MSYKTSPITLAITCIALFLGSFADEATQVILALRFSDAGQNAPAQVSALLAAGLLGGISAGFLSPYLITTFGARRIISAIFIGETILIYFASLSDVFLWALLVSTALGCLGAMLWAAVMVILPAIFTDDTEIDRVNRVVQSVRNLGYVVGPLIGSIFFAWFTDNQGLLYVALFMAVAAICSAVSLPQLVRADVGKEVSGNKGGRFPDVRGLLTTGGVLRAVMPLFVTVLVTSALNVLLIVRLRNEIGISTEIYGLIVALLSAGLVVGPIFFSAFIGKIGEASGASLAASMIGLGIVVLGSTEIAWQLLVAAVFVGIANGAQNSLMSGFIIKRVESTKRSFQMPAYILILQTAVFIGFAGSALIKSEQTGATLVAAGSVAMIVGTFGVFLNHSKKISRGNEK